jgi:hypothetical protein
MNKGIRLIALLLTATMTYGEMRTWTSKKGQILEAEYVRDAAGKVVLKTRSGAEKQIPISAFSKKDQDYIYGKTPPKLEIKFDTNEKSRSVRGDIDNRTEDLKPEAIIIKTSSRPYTGKLKAQFFVLGRVLEEKRYILLDSKEETFTIAEKSGSEYRIQGKKLNLEHDPSPGFGVKYEGYLVCVKTADGKIIAAEGKSLFEKKIDNLMKAKEHELLDRNLKATGRKYSNSYYY